MESISNRYEFVILFDVENGNPNGDPDAGNMPRMIPSSSHGLVSDVCIKRKIRNVVSLITEENPEGHEIYVREKAILNKQHERAYNSEKVIQTDKMEEKIKFAKEWMCKNFYDVKTFGAVMSTGNFKCETVCGPVQINIAKSINPIMPMNLCITRMAVTTEADAEKQNGDNRTMGRKYIIPYGLYRAEGFISAYLAKKTGFSEDDLELLWKSLEYMFEHDRSASRGKMCLRKLIIFKHDSKLGNAPAQKLFDLVQVSKNCGDDVFPQSYSDYTVLISDNIPSGVTLIERV